MQSRCHAKIRKEKGERLSPLPSMSDPGAVADGGRQLVVGSIHPGIDVDAANRRRELAAPNRNDRRSVARLRKKVVKLAAMGDGDLPGAVQELAGQSATRLVVVEELAHGTAQLVSAHPGVEVENPLGEVGSVDVRCAREANAVGLHGGTDGALAFRLVGEKDDHGATDGDVVGVEDSDDRCNLAGGHVIGTSC